MKAVLSRKTLTLAGTLLLLACLPLLAGWLGNSYLVSLFTRVLIYAMAAVSLDLLLGYSNLISLGHAAFVGVGAYVVGICHQHAAQSELIWGLFPGSENALVVWPLAVLTAAVFALVIGALSLRTSGMHFIMITLAFAQMLHYLFIGLEHYGGDDGIVMTARNTLPGLDLATDSHLYYLCLGLLLIILLGAHRLVRSRFGLVLRAASHNTERIHCLGINAYPHRLTGFVIAGAIAGLAGALLANQATYVSPGLLHWTLSGELMVMVLLGGLGSLVGPMFGAALFLLLEETLAMYTEHWMVFMGPILIVVVLFARRGIFGLLVGRERGDD